MEKKNYSVSSTHQNDGSEDRRDFLSLASSESRGENQIAMHRDNLERMEREMHNNLDSMSVEEAKRALEMIASERKRFYEQTDRCKDNKKFDDHSRSAGLQSFGLYDSRDTSTLETLGQSRDDNKNAMHGENLERMERELQNNLDSMSVEDAKRALEMNASTRKKLNEQSDQHKEARKQEKHSWSSTQQSYVHQGRSDNLTLEQSREENRNAMRQNEKCHLENKERMEREFNNNLDSMSVEETGRALEMIASEQRKFQEQADRYKTIDVQLEEKIRQGGNRDVFQATGQDHRSFHHQVPNQQSLLHRQDRQQQSHLKAVEVQRQQQIIANAQKTFMEQAECEKEETDRKQKELQEHVDSHMVKLIQAREENLEAINKKEESHRDLMELMQRELQEKADLISNADREHRRKMMEKLERSYQEEADRDRKEAESKIKKIQEREEEYMNKLIQLQREDRERMREKEERHQANIERMVKEFKERNSSMSSADRKHAQEMMKSMQIGYQRQADLDRAESDRWHRDIQERTVRFNGVIKEFYSDMESRRRNCVIC